METKRLLTVSSLLLGSLLLTACSQNETANVASAIPAAVAVKATVATSENTHTHPKHECTNSVTHTHPNGNNSHTHRYSCKNSGKEGEVAHVHPENDCTRAFSHAHPNARADHRHDYRCNR